MRTMITTDWRESRVISWGILGRPRIRLSLRILGRRGRGGPENKDLRRASGLATPNMGYRTGLVDPDFPGIARDRRLEETGVPHVHFDGAGGNIGAGK